MKKLVLATIAAGLIAAPAMASDFRCTDAPIDQWMSEQALKEKITGMGYEVRRIKVDDGCYEVYALDGNGMQIEAKYHPVTGEMVRAGLDD
ncbi:PepSY domain-containing protein [Oricola thermophila]|uniref:PepSY domain-containing protein n=1 Tax=Oricola thermophila TaxID=2742145 RepID=A0A6N1VJ59_9HYPH|nr:PepSY domain-containing protein [Oricola thermophila]QKV19259.1 PepSY domain-containing protein [Oricola thermophila]